MSDFNKDEVHDILLAGNKFNVEIETTPADASIGLFMEGKDGLKFKPLGPNYSGVFLPENVKTLKRIKFGNTMSGSWSNGLLVGVNNKTLKVLRY